MSIVLVSSWDKQSPLVAWKIDNLGSVETEAVTRRIIIGESRNGHGLGLGDIDGDGLPDLLFEDGWYERPADAAFGRPWTLHEDWSIHATIPMLVVDVDGDGRNDVIVGEAHDYGLYWLRQIGDGGATRFERHTIDDTFSQAHALHLADLDGDGDEELLAGKRVLAHNGNDPGGLEPPCLFYYEWNQSRQAFERFVINEGRVGAGLQIHTGDLDGNGRTDIVVAGKNGTYLLLNE